MRLPDWAKGLASAPVLLLGIGALVVALWPDARYPATFVRIFENLLPHMVLALLAGTGLLALLRVPRGLVWLSLVLAVSVGALVVGSHLRRAHPLAPTASAELTVLWFNILSNNQTPPEQLASALIASEADIVMISEAAPLISVRQVLAQHFAQRAGCEDARHCTLLVLARSEDADITLHEIGRTNEARLAVVQTPTAAGRQATLLGLHLFKPWFYGIVESELWGTLDVLKTIKGPLVAFGDLNAAPWSRRGRILADDCNLRALPLPRPTWPAQAGWLGLPIDNVLARDARLVSVDRWGTDLGSNHAGLLVTLSLDGTDPQSPRPRQCRPPYETLQ